MLIIKVARRNLLRSTIQKGKNWNNFIHRFSIFIETLSFRQQSMLTLTSSYYFVNIPISSNYYHSVLPTEIEACMKLAERENVLNEKIFLLQHIAEIAVSDPKFIRYDLDKFMIKQLSLWLNGKGRFQRVASVAWIIHHLNLKQKLKVLYQEIIERIDNDEWYVDFDETVKALQAYCTYEDNEKKTSVFQKIERNLGIALTDVNMTYYQRICNSLMVAQRDRSPIWDQIQPFVTRNLSMEYIPSTFFDIFKAFAITRNGSQVFYEICHQVIHKGHLYKLTSPFISNLGDFNSSGDYFALIVQTYAIVYKTVPFPLSSDFLDYLYKSMLTSKLQYYNISSLTKITKFMPALQFHPQEVQNVIYYVINNKQFSQYHSLTEIQQLYFTISEKLGFVPDKLMLTIQKLVKKDMDSNLLPLPKAIELVQFLLSWRTVKQKNSIELIQSLRKTIQKKSKYIVPEELKIVLRMICQNQQVNNLIQKQDNPTLLIKQKQN